jgi:hypothetical protein
LKLITLLVSALLLVQSAAFASQRIEDAKFSRLVTEAQSLVQKYGAENVVVGFDIDDTLLAAKHLLAAKQDLISDRWFVWQSGMLTAGDLNNPGLVAKDMGSLLQLWGGLLPYASTHPVEKDIPAIVEYIQNQLKLATLVVTARGSETRSVTERELKKNGFHFENSGIRGTVGTGVPTTFLPWDLKAPERAGLSADDVTRMKLSDAREVSYRNGIYMVAGQNKGATLRALLHHAGVKPQAVLFIDDTAKNVDAVLDAFSSTSVDTVAIRYSYEDATKAAFAKDPSKAVKEWNYVRAALGKVFAQ